jgi:hypothetical protein
MIRAQITGGRTILAKVFYDPFVAGATRHDRQPKRKTIIEFYEEVVDDGAPQLVHLHTETASNHVTEQFVHAVGRTWAFKAGLRKLLANPSFNMGHEDFTVMRAAFLRRCPTSKAYWG